MRPSALARAVAVGVVYVAGAAVALGGFAATDTFLPMVGRQAGLFPSNWYTTIWIYNPGVAPATARIYLLERGTANPSPPWVEVLVAPGDTEKIENVVESLFHTQVFGALRVTCDTQKLVITSRVYSKGAGAGEKDSAGQDFAGVPASFAIGVGEKTQVLGVYQTEPAAESDYRFNFGFVETTGHTVTVRVTAYDGTNAYQGYKDFQVREFSQRQVAFKDHFPTVSAENARLEVEVTLGTGKIIAYGSGIANASQDPTTFEMQYTDTLLAQAASSGITDVTAGQGLTGGGTVGAVSLDVGAGAGISVSADQVSLADGGVTAIKLAVNAVTSDKILDGTISAADTGFNYAGSTSKGGAASDLACAGCVALPEISSSGAVSDQVVKYNGGAVVWGADQHGDLTLPFSGSGNQAEPNAVFLVSNSSTGPAVQGTSTSPGVGVRGVGTTGVEGDSGSGTGVLGNSTSLYGVHGLSSSGIGVRGDSTDSRGVYGTSTNSDGVWGRAANASAAGVRGEHTAAGNGVRGESLTGAGVYGASSSSGNFGYLGSGAYGALGQYGASGPWGYLGGSSHGAYGVSSGNGGAGVLGENDNSQGFGVYGTSSNGIGVNGYSSGGSGVGVKGSGGTGVYGESGSGTGVYGIANGPGFGAYGVSGSSGNYGWLGGGGQGAAGISSGSIGVFGQSSSGAGVSGTSNSNDGVSGFSGSGTGVYGSTTSGFAGRFDGRTMISGSATGDLVYIENTGSGRGLHVVTGSDTALWAATTTGFAALDARKPGGRAGYFNGNVEVTGSVTKSSGSFKIDHPLDPEHKYLCHSFVESPDMKNVYDGVVTTDENGLAVVELPQWFEALNRDFRYQLTVIGRFAQAIVEKEVESNRFTIRTNLAKVKVSWQITGIRQDHYANAHRIRVEEEKPADERGFYLHPEEWGQPADKSVAYAHPPESRPPRDDREEQPR